MRITIESTERIIEVNGLACRQWEGETEHGVKIVALIPRIAVRNGQDTLQFEAELREQPPGKAADREAFSLRMII